MKNNLRLPKIFGEGCVLQQGENTRIWGWGAPGSRVRILLREQRCTADLAFQRRRPDIVLPGTEEVCQPDDGHAGMMEDTVLFTAEAFCGADGRFETCFLKLAAGGPVVLELAGEDGQSLQVREVYVGDVFVCGGQSNMELPMRRVRVRFPEEFCAGGAPFILHIYKVTEHYDFDAPLTDHMQASWQAAVRENLEELSAFSYFFGKEIALQRGIPVGILNLSLGGTPVEAWTSREGLKDSPEYLKITDHFRDINFCKNLLAKKERQEQNWYDSLCRQEEERGKKEDWQPITLPCEFKDTLLADFCGSLLLRKKFMVSQEQAGRAGVLRFGTLVDSDEMFLNGVKIGETGYQYPPRRYPVPEGLLREGENTLEIRLICRYGTGRVTPGKALDIIWEDVCRDSWIPETERAAFKAKKTQTDAMRTEDAHPAHIALDGAWEYRILAASEPAPEQVFLNRTPTGLYNGMVAPCQPYTVSAAVWYQGESNDSHPADYAKLLGGMIFDWRRGFRNRELPFVVVQLPNCGVDIAPGDAWPRIREAQLLAERIPYVAVTVNLDLGEDNDLHPLNKKAVAQRAALAVRSLVYREDVCWQGPRLQAVSRQGNSVRLTFRQGGCPADPGHAAGCCRVFLRESGASERENPRLFELAGSDGVYYPAEVEIDGNIVRLRSGQVKEPCAVRYAWADAPGKYLLYGENGLCAAPFSVRPGAQHS